MAKYVAQWIRKAMAEADVKPGELARLVNVRAESVSRWLGGRRVPRNKLTDIARALGKTESYFVQEYDPEDPRTADVEYELKRRLANHYRNALKDLQVSEEQDVIETLSLWIGRDWQLLSDEEREPYLRRLAEWRSGHSRRPRAP